MKAIAVVLPSPSRGDDSGLVFMLMECRERHQGGVSLGRRSNGFLGLSLNDKTIIFLVILLDKTVSVG